MELSACRVDLERREVHRDGQVFRLQPREAELLSWLVAHPGEPHERETLYQAIWRRPAEGRVLDVMVRLLRRKLEADPSRPDHLLTVHGVGYRWANLSTAALPARASRVPAEPPDSFVGRRGLFDALEGHLAEPGRAVVLQAPGGMGKTRVARRFLRKRVAWDQGLFVPLSQAHQAPEVHRDLAAALDVPLAMDTTMAEESQRLGTLLAGLGSCWVVLDNVEQVAAIVAEQLANWRQQAPDIRWLLTSRIRVAGDDLHHLELAPLSAGESLELMEARARERVAGWTLKEGERAEALALCQDLDGIPLAVEMAARRLPLVGVRQLRRRLQAHAETLASSRQDLPPRQRQLDATIAGSWDLLGASARRTLVYCAVMEGPFTPALFFQVCGQDSRAALMELVDNSLLVAGDGFYTLYEIVRQWCRQHEDFRGQEEALRTRHAEVLLAWEGPEHLADLLAAKDWLLSRSPDQAVEAALLAHVILQRSGPLALHREVLDQAVEAAVRSGVPTLEARTLEARAEALGQRGLVADAGRDLERALACAEGSPAVLALVRLRWGWLEERTGNLAASEVHLRQALEDGRQEEALEARIQVTLGNTLRQLSQPAEALALLALAHKDAAKRGDWTLEALIAGTRALMASTAGDLDATERHLQEALSLYRRTDNPVAEANCLGNLAVLAFRRGQRIRALDLFEDCRDRAAQLGNRDGQAVAMCNRGSVLMGLGRLEEAGEEWAGALDLARALDKPELEGAVQLLLGVLAQIQGDLAEAEVALESALLLLGPQSPYRCRALSHGAALWAARGDLARAEAWMSRARELPGTDEGGRHHGLVEALEGCLDLARGARGDLAQGVSIARGRLAQADVPGASDEIEAAAELLRQALQSHVRRVR